MKKFKLPREEFPKITDFFLYKLGFSNFSNKEVLLKIINYLGKTAGLVRADIKDRHDPDYPKYKCSTAFGEEPKPIIAFGGDFYDEELAMSKMIGEYLERFVFSKTKQHPYVQSKTIKELREIFEVKLPFDFHKKTQQQLDTFGEFLINENEEVKCLMLEDILKRSKILYPLQLVFYSKEFLKDSFLMAPRNSNGSAGGFDLNMATVNALFEIIERDSFLIHWLTKSPAKQIVIDESIPLGIRNQIDCLGKYGFKINIFDMTSDIQVPTAMIICTDVLEKNNRTLTATSTAQSFKEAVLGALREVNQLLFIYKLNWVDYQTNFSKPFLDKATDIGNRYLYLWKENLRELDFFYKSGEFSFEEASKNDFLEENEEKILEFVVTKISKAIPDLNIYRYVSKDLLLKKLGFIVVKIIIPQMLSIYLTESDATPITRRAKEFLEYKGITKKYEPNPFPHPFP